MELRSLQTEGFQLFDIEAGDREVRSMRLGANLSLPTLLFIHGGTGYPDMMFSHCYDKPLLSDFNIVRYDQSGSGLSKGPDIVLSELTMEYLEIIEA